MILNEKQKSYNVIACLTQPTKYIRMATFTRSIQLLIAYPDTQEHFPAYTSPLSPLIATYTFSGVSQDSEYDTQSCEELSDLNHCSQDIDTPTHSLQTHHKKLIGFQ